ncbi:MAG: hypothetical protein Q8L48_19470 [Archangium sp.]|nr:hypothetical protein [Archangium sp.]
MQRDAYDYLAKTRNEFDVVFCSYGVIGWLENLRTRARRSTRGCRSCSG